MRPTTIAALVLAVPLIVAATAEAQCTNAASVRQIGTPTPGVDFLSTAPRLGQTARLGMQIGCLNRFSLPRFTMLVSAKPAKLPFLSQTLYVHPNTILAHINGTFMPGFTPGKVYAQVSIPIPNDRSLCGRKAVFQAGIFWNCGITTSLVLTHGLELTIGK